MAHAAASARPCPVSRSLSRRRRMRWDLVFIPLHVALCGAASSHIIPFPWRAHSTAACAVTMQWPIAAVSVTG